MCYTKCVTKTKTLSVRLDPETRRLLGELASTHDAAGASALAREILERWVSDARAAKRRESLERAVSYLRTSGEWNDDPAEFFPTSEKE